MANFQDSNIAEFAQQAVAPAIDALYSFRTVCTRRAAMNIRTDPTERTERILSGTPDLGLEPHPLRPNPCQTSHPTTSHASPGPPSPETTDNGTMPPRHGLRLALCPLPPTRPLDHPALWQARGSPTLLPRLPVASRRRSALALQET